MREPPDPRHCLGPAPRPSIYQQPAGPRNADDARIYHMHCFI